MEPSPARPAALAFILVTVVLDVLAFGIVIPVLPKLVEQFMGGDTPRAAQIYGVFGTAWALMQFVCAPIHGMLSDRFGRRPLILMSCFGLGLDFLLMALAPSLWWLFAGRVISGIMAASFSTAAAYVADVTPQAQRAAAFGMIGAAWGFGFVVGPALGGVLGGIAPRLPFWVAAGLCMANAAYGYFVLPESLPRERRSAFSLKKANPVGSLVLLRSHPELFGLAVVYALAMLAHLVFPSVFVLYAGYRYHWSAVTVGLTLTLVGVCSIAVAGLVKLAVARLGERRTLLLGLAFAAAEYAWIGLAPTSVAVWIGIVLLSPAGLYSAALQGLMTRRVSPTEQGQLQGANGSMQGIVGMIGPGLFTLSLAHFIAPGRDWVLPGAPFLLAAALAAGSLLLAWRVTRTRATAVVPRPEAAS
ncbi:MAG TPA: TCR/Tet family MFS transporter [Solimonas sp.]|nr:TCR/Tet family MFS transporter [Solimonas sp.]